MHISRSDVSAPRKKANMMIISSGRTASEILGNDNFNYSFCVNIFDNFSDFCNFTKLLFFIIFKFIFQNLIF